MRKINVRDFKRATQSTSQEINRQIVLNLVREHQPISRAEIGRRMEVERGKVSALVNRLLEEGAVYEGDTADAPRGRKPRMLYLRTQDRLVVAIDIRFSQTYVMLGDFAGSQIALETFDTLLDPEALVKELSMRIRRLLCAHENAGDCEGIGVVIPGIVDHSTGRILNAPQLGWRDVDIRDSLSEATHLPVFVETAPVACALAQMWHGVRGSNTGNFAYVIVADGVGAGVVVNGQVLRGLTSTAGEFAHIPLYLDGVQCLCGRRGCLEAYTSNLATLSRYLGLELSSPNTRRTLQQSSLTISELIFRARAGDSRAIDALRKTGRFLGFGVANIVNLLNPDEIFIGGELTAAWDLIETQLRASVVERALTRASAETPIIPDSAEGYPRLRGATALLAAREFAAPQVA